MAMFNGLSLLQFVSEFLATSQPAFPSFFSTIPISTLSPKQMKDSNNSVVNLVNGYIK
jgi:hypothetical protein